MDRPLEEYKKVVQDCFPDNAKKTHDIYSFCQQLIKTGLYAQLHQGDHLMLCIQTHVKHSPCFDKYGICERPDNFLARTKKTKDIDNCFEPSLAGDKGFTKDAFKAIFNPEWDRFGHIAVPSET